MPENIERKNPTTGKGRKLTFKETGAFLEYVAKEATAKSKEIAAKSKKNSK